MYRKRNDFIQFSQSPLIPLVLIEQIGTRYLYVIFYWQRKEFYANLLSLIDIGSVHGKEINTLSFHTFLRINKKLIVNMN